MVLGGLPPAADEIELSVFGPGVGESSVIHTGDGRWIVVDSCRDRSGAVPALDYLSGLGVELRTDVDWVVATHAHDDHIDGLADIVETCASANVVLPQATDVDEFFALIKLDSRLEYYDTRWRIYREYERIFSILEQSRRHTSSLFFADLGTSLPITSPYSPRPSVELFFVAPSNLAVLRSKRVLGRVLHAAVGSGKARLTKRDPNGFSSALIIRCPDCSVLIGGDVKNGGPGWGWRHATATLGIMAEIDAFKVAHHGDPKAHHNQVWTQWLKPDANAIVTPYRPSHRPRPADLARMLATGRDVWGTSDGGPIAKSKATRRVSAELRRVTTRVEEVSGYMGQVRYRRTAAGAIAIDLDGPAYKAA